MELIVFIPFYLATVDSRFYFKQKEKFDIFEIHQSLFFHENKKM